jgi:glycosyltransferase involved in cell wall biosynthesis
MRYDPSNNSVAAQPSLVALAQSAIGGRKDAGPRLPSLVSAAARIAKGQAAHSLSHFAKARFRRRLKSAQLDMSGLRKTIRWARHVVVCVVRNEGHRLSFFLDYYRKLGIEHFIVIDNQSTDETAALLARFDDVSRITAAGSYKAARFGNDWINEIINRYCREKWVLYVDADEFLVFPHDDSKSIADLTRYMTRAGMGSLRAVMVDMYSDRHISANICAPGQDPLEICSLFDASGYSVDYVEKDRTLWIKGGVRGRVYFSDQLWNGPALNKLPLVHVGGERLYLKSSHQIWPLDLNRPQTDGGPQVTAALLHYKFLSNFAENVTDRPLLSEHTAEYAAYSAERSAGSFVGEPTRTYHGWRDLAGCGLIEGDKWIEA